MIIWNLTVIILTMFATPPQVQYMVSIFLQSFSTPSAPCEKLVAFGAVGWKVEMSPDDNSSGFNKLPSAPELLLSLRIHFWKSEHSTKGTSRRRRSRKEGAREGLCKSPLQEKSG